MSNKDEEGSRSRSANEGREDEEEENSDDDSYAEEIACSQSDCKLSVIKHKSGWLCEECLRWYCEGHQADTGTSCEDCSLWYCEECSKTTHTCRCCWEDLV